jgi:methylmalonyl-CoA mutase
VYNTFCLFLQINKNLPQEIAFMSNEPIQPGNIEIKKTQFPDPCADFPPPAFEEWLALAGKNLAATTYENSMVQPLYRKEDIENIPFLDNMPGFPPYVRGTRIDGCLKKSWEICQEIDCASAAVFNRELRNNLERGQTAVNLVLDEIAQMGMDADRICPDEAGDNGVSISTYEDFAAALAGVDLESHPLFVEAGLVGLEILMMLAVFCDRQGINPLTLRGGIESDPLALLLVAGRLPIPMKSAFDRLALAVRFSQHFSPGVKTIGVKGSIFSDAGADPTGELAFSLAAAVEYIDRMMERGLVIDEIAPAIRFTFGIGSFFFLEIARLRAARILWSNIIAAYGGNEESRKMTIHARTSFYNQTRSAAHVNILRAATAAFSAALAGVDSLHTSAFDEAGGKTDSFSRRIARNIQLILKEEAHLDRLIDPAGGSYFVEKLTHETAQKTWSLFQEIQGKGGMLKAAQQGFPQAEIEKAAKKREQEMSAGKRIIVGVNVYTAGSAEDLTPTTPDKKERGEFYRNRAEYLEKYRAARDKAKHRALLGQIPHLMKRGQENMIREAAQCFPAGVTLGEFFQTARIETGEILLIDPLRIHRAAEIFEKAGKQKGESS